MYLYGFIAADTSVLERYFPPSRTTEGNLAPASPTIRGGFSNVKPMDGNPGYCIKPRF